MFRKRSHPQLLEFLKRKAQRFTLGKDEQMVSGYQVWVNRSNKFTKNPLRPIAPDGVSKSPADDDSNLAYGTLHSAREQIETLR
jgi:hypothetical protein